MGLRQFLVSRSTGTGRQVNETIDGSFIENITETIPVASFTDGGATVGTYVMTQAIPSGALILAARIGPVVGFAGDTTAALTIGDGSDVDRYNTGTPTIFTTAAVGVDAGVPSGLKLLTASNRPTLTVTSSADFTSVVSNGAGVVTITIYYIQT
jgi:hypothetical protein